MIARDDTRPRPIALVGCGEIARREHAAFLCSGENDTGFRLVATADPKTRLPSLDVRHYRNHREMLAAEPELTAVVVCTPTFTHFEIAKDTLLARKHTLLEKPPTSTSSELLKLQEIAEQSGVVLYTSFHAQHNVAVHKAAGFLSDAGASRDLHVAIDWRENFERWHGGQAWPWRRGGCGVFDSGINALSILTRVLPDTNFRVLAAKFLVPANAETPSSAAMQVISAEDARGDFRFDWTKDGDDCWEIAVRSTDSHGAQETITIKNFHTLLRNDEVVFTSPDRGEYACIYREFFGAVVGGISNISFKEIRLIDGAFELAEVEKSDIRY